jgi:hypothetical protein
MVTSVGRAFMRLGAKILAAFDLGRFVHQNPQRLAGAVQALRQQRGVRCLQWVAFNALCHCTCSFVWLDQSCRRNRSPDRGRAAARTGRPPRADRRFATLRSDQHVENRRSKLQKGCCTKGCRTQMHSLLKVLDARHSCAKNATNRKTT